MTIKILHFPSGQYAYQDSHVPAKTLLPIETNSYRPIYTSENFGHGMDENGKKCSMARVKFCGVNDFAVPNFTHAGPKFQPCLDLLKR